MDQQTLELCKRLAEKIMKWRIVDNGDLMYADQSQNLVACVDEEDDECYGDPGIRWWHPDSDIAQAMMVAERIAEDRASFLVLTRHLNPPLWRAQFPFHVDYECGADTPAMAIATAADAWLKQGGGNG